jgi:hypothetical protein
VYIDPGFGALLLQGLAAAVVGAAFVVRKRIVGLFRKLTGKPAAPAGEPPASGPAPPPRGPE